LKLSSKPVDTSYRKPINISKSFFGKPPGFNVEFGICSIFRETGENKKSSLTSGD